VRPAIQRSGSPSRTADVRGVVDVDELLEVLDGVDAAVVAVRLGDPHVIGNAAARSLYALPEHRPALVDDLACRVRIFHAQRLRRLGLDDLPLIRALAGRPCEVEAIVLDLGSDRIAQVSDRIAQVLDPASTRQGRRVMLRARPMLSGGQVVGSVCTAQDLTDLHTEHAQLARRASELAAIHRATRAVLTDEDARRAVCEAALRVSGAAAASLYEPDGRGELVRTTHVGAASPGDRLPLAGPSAVAEVFACGERRVLTESGPNPMTARFPPDPASSGAIGLSQSRGSVGSAVWLPVRSRDGCCVAVLSLVFGPEVPIGEHLPVLEILAGETAVAVERQDLLRRLRREASSDGLTGAANRRAWDAELPQALARGRREGRPVAVVMLDLDHFKEYNDAFGHPAGDALLRDAVRAWRCGLRPDDLLCRYGGEEFVVLLPGCDLEQAQEVAEQLRALVPHRQTCSAGVAEWDRTEDAPALVARLDAALYAAKIAGRDRVHVAP
jgi:diguanylate cyclase (GGDEF)-like protein